MHQAARKSLTAFGVALTLGLGSVGPSGAHVGPEHGAPLHGGTVSMTREYHFEVVLAKDGLKVYPRTLEDKPIDASRLTGTATFLHPGSPKPWFARELRPAPSSQGQAPYSLSLAMDLSQVPASGVKVALQVTGLPDPAETTATFTVPFTLIGAGELAVTTATKADQSAIVAQKVCPVSKEELGSMGAPIKVTRGNRSVFLCCKGCLRQLKTNPDKYLGASTSSGATTAKEDHQH